MRRFVLYISLLFLVILPCHAIDYYDDAELEVNVCINQYFNNPRDGLVLEDVIRRLDVVNKRIKVTLSGERDYFNQPYTLRSDEERMSFAGLKAITSLFLEFFQSIPYKTNLNIFTLDELNEVNELIGGVIKIEKINLNLDNLEFWEITFGEGKLCYVHNLSKTMIYSFVVKTRSSTFEGSVLANSLRVVSNNLNPYPYLRPTSVKIVSERRYIPMR